MKIICIGRNYTEHIKELNNENPEEPVIFIKPDTALLRNNNPFFIPDFSRDVHHEVEVVVKIKKPGRHIPLSFAKDYYDEVALGIDFTARDVQSNLKAKGLPWEKSKAFNGSAFVSKMLPFHSSVIENTINFHLNLNENLVQSGNSSLMIWNVFELIEDISKYFTLKTGDYIFTGTPAGVGPVQKGDLLSGYLTNDKLFDLTIL